MSQDEIEKIKDVKNRHVNDLMSYYNVTGVGIGYKEVGGEETSTLCIRVYVIDKLPESELEEKDVLPSSIEEIPVDVIESGEIKAL